MNIVVLPPTPGTVAAYLRVSSRVQRDREMIASQREAVLEHAGGRSWTVPGERVFADDGFSGATLDRPALEALRDAVAGGEVETVVAWSADRLSRNFAHQMLLQEEFARHGARIVFVQEPDAATPQGMLLRQMPSAISEYERTQIAERSRRGKIHRARRGSLNMISRPPYGYRLIRKTEACGAWLEIDDAEAVVVRRIYELHVREGLKMHAVSRRLDAEGIRSRHAECWPTATVAVIPGNEAYVGRGAYLKTVGTGKPARRNRTGRRKAGTVRRLTGRAARPREAWIELPVPVIVEETVFARAQRRPSPRPQIGTRRGPSGSAAWSVSLAPSSSSLRLARCTPQGEPTVPCAVRDALAFVLPTPVLQAISGSSTARTTQAASVLSRPSTSWAPSVDRRRGDPIACRRSLAVARSSTQSISTTFAVPTSGTSTRCFPSSRRG